MGGFRSGRLKSLSSMIPRSNDRPRARARVAHALRDADTDQCADMDAHCHRPRAGMPAGSGGMPGVAVIFETLYDSAKRGELLLIDGGMCHWHLRRDGQLTIREIISTRKGAGGEMLATLKAIPGALFLFAKCPIDLEANAWYARRGFICTGEEITKTGRRLKLWTFSLA